MIDWSGLRGFDWDDGNRFKSADKHGVGWAEAEQVFFNEPLLIVDDPKHSEAEPRFQALGHTSEGRMLHITFTLRGSGAFIRVVSARPMSRKEREWYVKNA